MPSNESRAPSRRTAHARDLGFLSRLVRAAGLLLCGALLAHGAIGSESQPAPAFKLRDLDGRWVVLQDVLKTGPAVIVFWATCCGGTHPLMLHLEQIQQRYREHGFTVLAVSVDDTKTASRVRPWVRARRLTYPVLLDPTGDVMRLYQVAATPHILLVDREQRIVASHSGFLPGDEQTHEREIRALLGLTAETP